MKMNATKSPKATGSDTAASPAEAATITRTKTRVIPEPVASSEPSSSKTTPRQPKAAPAAKSVSSFNGTARSLTLPVQQPQPPQPKDDDDGSCYYQDDTILIRRFQEGDQEPVQQVFRNAIESNIPWAIYKFSTSPAFGLGALALAGLAQGLIRLTARVAVVSLLGSSSSSNSNTNNSASNNNTTTRTVDALAWTGSVAAAAGLYHYFREKITTGYQGFIETEIKNDLSNIPAVYLKPRGTFLVAIDPQSQEIVGCIAGQDKNDAPKDDQRDTDDKESYYSSSRNPAFANHWQFEIRRLAVRDTHRRRKLAQRLLAILEERLLDGSKKGSITKDTTTSMVSSSTSTSVLFPGMLLFLTCSSNQVPAHHFYAKLGYQRTQAFLPPKAPGWIRWFGFQMYRYERRFEA
mmetsp:Transcript_21866/g.60794  ORF Transcript_21866/g.60794 Transcript_21866/m.60794 type:complete len:406 (+) Transcript_21866:1-1218(+)